MIISIQNIEGIYNYHFSIIYLVENHNQCSEWF